MSHNPVDALTIASLSAQNALLRDGFYAPRIIFELDPRDWDELRLHAGPCLSHSPDEIRVADAIVRRKAAP